MLSCSWFSPFLVTEENCQLSTSDSWAQEAEGGDRKKRRFCRKYNHSVGIAG